ncbi:MAG: hypothetical protein IJ071_10875 [Ruminococcus sp.]|nr:hypothetical protein [Ruminococcus sp.]
MKRLIILAAAALLYGCAEAGESSASQEAPTAAATAAVTTTATTTAQTTTAQTTTVQTTTVQTTTELMTFPPFEMPEEEQAAIQKLCDKYDKDFTVLDRYVEWEFYGEIPDVKPVSYYIDDGEGHYFYAFGKENTDEITSDSYLFVKYGDRLMEESAEFLRGLTSQGKCWAVSYYKNWLPFETPADATYEEFLAAFSAEESHVQVNLLLPEGEVPPEELRPELYNSSKIFDDLGYHISVAVRHIPQEDYDRLEDVSYGKIDVDYQKLQNAYMN